MLRLCPQLPISTRTCPAQLTCRRTRCNNLHQRFCRTNRQKLSSIAPVLREMLLRTPPVNWRRWVIRTCRTTLKASRTGLTPGYLLRASTNTNLLALIRIKEMSYRYATHLAAPRLSSPRTPKNSTSIVLVWNRKVFTKHTEQVSIDAQLIRRVFQEVNNHEGLDSILPNYGFILSRNGRDFTDTHTAQFTYWSWGLSARLYS